MLTVGETVLKSASYLAGKGVDSPRLDAELLLCRILNTDRLHLYMDWQKPLTELEVAAYRESIRRRGQDREPVARIIGFKAFHGREFKLSPATFVPRPETEGVVERALMLLETEEALKRGPTTVFEVGTGTGCIIVSIAAETDGHRFIATDVSPGALAVARENAHKYHVDRRIEFREGAGFAGYRGSLGMIVSNPPYIEREEIPGLAPEVSKHDPLAALDGGKDGLDVVRTIAAEGMRLLVQGGWVILELGEGQPERAAELFRATGLAADVRIERDLAGIDRYLMVQRKNEARG